MPFKTKVTSLHRELRPLLPYDLVRKRAERRPSGQVWNILVPGNGRVSNFIV